MFRLAFLLLLCGVIIVTVDSDAVERIVGPSDPVSSVARANSGFASDLYQVLRQRLRDDGNFVVSPLSLSVLLTMLNIGCRGEAYQEIAAALKQSDLKEDKVVQGYSQLLESLKNEASYTLESANKIYTDVTFQLQRTYKDILKSYFESEPEDVNFQFRAVAVNEINAWIAQKTGNKITNLLAIDAVDHDTKAVLVNAMYFYSAWETPFKTSETRFQPFYSLDNNEPTTTEFLRTFDMLPFGYIEELDSFAISIPYKGNRLSFIIILPRDVRRFKDLEDGLKTYDITRIPGQLTVGAVNLEFPKLDMRSNVDFVSEYILQKLGIYSVLGLSGKDPDLSGMAENSTGLFVGNVVQDTYLKFTEEGTEGASASVAKVFARTFPFAFIADRPFVGFVFDSYTKSILFLLRKVK